MRRVLRAKFDMGLFEDPFPAAAPEDWPNLIHTDKALEVAKQLDLESIVLLENHDNTLPLKDDIGSIAVIGPFADTVNVSLVLLPIFCIINSSPNLLDIVWRLYYVTPPWGHTARRDPEQGLAGSSCQACKRL